MNKRRIIAGAIALTLVAAACGDDDDDSGSDSTEAPAEEEAEVAETAAEEEMSEDTAAGGDSSGSAEIDPSVTGSVSVSGSSTVEPISVRVQELFNDVASGVDIVVDGPGTGDGFQLFCNGETDISDASRAIKEEEAATCEENGIEYTELQVGIDGIGVMTSPANEAVTCMTFEDIYGVVGPESTGFTSWSDANDLIVELGGEGNLPDAELVIFGPGEESGTFDSFIEIVLEGIAEERGEEAITRPDYNPSANDNVIIEGISSNDTSFGWVGFAFAENAENVKLIEVDGGEGCVAATPETIASNEYPVSRPLFIYVNDAKADENPALQAYVDFYMAEGLDVAVSEVGYVALADDAKEATRSAWTGR